jgi:hypothetical protein
MTPSLGAVPGRVKLAPVARILMGAKQDLSGRVKETGQFLPVAARCERRSPPDGGHRPPLQFIKSILYPIKS